MNYWVATGGRRIKKNPRDFEIDYVGLLKRDLVRRRQKGPLGFY